MANDQQSDPNSPAPAQSGQQQPQQQPQQQGNAVRGDTAGTQGGGERKPYEQWGAQHKTPAWLIDAARHGRAWPMGQEVTEDDFNQAVYDAAHAPIR